MRAGAVAAIGAGHVRSGPKADMAVLVTRHSFEGFRASCAARNAWTSLREWAYVFAYQTSYQRKQQLPTWLHRYNWHRPHAGIGDKTPISRLDLTENNVLRFHS
jgi:hypothetical protein